MQAREYLHFRLTGAQHTTPVAMMTSEAKNNDAHMRRLLRDLQWFGRGPEAFRRGHAVCLFASTATCTLRKQLTLARSNLPRLA